MEYNCLTRETLDNLRQDGFPEDLISKLNDQNKIRYDQRVAEMTFPTEATPTGELRIVLLGQSGAGKSATGNLLLGENKFEESAMSEACTLTLREECTELNGVRVRIIDTPASCDHIKTERVTNLNINKEDKSKVVGTLPPDERQHASFYEREIWAELAEKSLQEMEVISHAQRESIKARVARKTGRLVTGQIHLAIEKILDGKVQRFRTSTQRPDPPASSRGTRTLGLMALSAGAGLLLFTGVKNGWVKPTLAWPL